MAKDLNSVSRTVSHALRHEPWLYELELDDEGWTDVEKLLVALHQESAEWAGLAAADLADMIRVSSKQRHEMIGGRIRALYGHSVPGKLTKIPAVPPTYLFHGTASASETAIRRDGLLPMGRQYVHLSPDREMAAAVGRRKSPNPVILTVRAAEASHAGVTFYEGNDKVWLADLVPSKFVE